MTDQIIQLVGAALILTAFTAAQTGRWQQKSVRYLVPNLIGSAALALDAVHGRQWGFLLLEGSWAIVSLAGLVALRRSAASAGRLSDRLAALRRSAASVGR